MPEDKLSYVNFVVFVYLHWDGLSIIHDSNGACFLVYSYIYFGHFVIFLIVVCRIHQDLIKYFIQTWDKFDFFVLESGLAIV